MEDRFIEENVKNRLILSGIRELEEHGISDFSLRRAALAAQVSCAAPYRHFKSKEEYINEIVLYVSEKWELLSKQICEVFKNDTRVRLIETCMANLRFRMANRNFPLLLLHTRESGKGIEDSIDRAVADYARENTMSEEETKLKIFTARALIIGAVSIMSEENTDEILSLIKKKLCEEFK